MRRTAAVTVAGPVAAAAAAALVAWGAAPVSAAPQWPQAAFPLTVSADRSHLEDGLGRPFFANGDAAWSLIAELHRAEAELYLADRRARGFNTLLVSLIEHRFSSNPPANAYGELPFLAPGRFDLPNPAYFDHAAWLLERAEAMGFLVLLAPAYLGYGGTDEGWFVDMVAAGPEQLRAYGRFLAGRFGYLQNIVWTQAGDWDPPDKSIVEAIAMTIDEMLPDALQTVHAAPETVTAAHWADAPWLDIDTAYTYHDVYAAVARQAEDAFDLPVLMIESSYENEHGATEQTLRRAAYGAILAGAAGHVFGNNPIWHFSSGGLYGAPRGWRDELSGRGSQSMTHFRELFETLDWWTLRADAGGALCGFGGGLARVDCGRAPDGSLAVVYAAEGGQLQLDLRSMADAPVCARWYDPSSGAFDAADGSPWAASTVIDAAPPRAANAGGFRDWVLVMTVCDPETAPGAG